jgi:FAD/FMN-containing dehydrogenase
MTDASAINELARTLQGQLIQPGDDSYDTARAIWNGMIDNRPRLIARCASVADIMSSVNFAREHDMIVSIRGGGHGVAGKAVCEDGLMIDLSSMKVVHVDANGRIARVEPGATLGDLDRATQAVGLATPGGLVSETGVAGLTLGGGIGYLARRFGLTADNLIAADVVTAAGELIRTSQSEHPDLFWALRGGGGNFGIVTSFEFRLHEVGPEVLVGQIFYPVENAKQVLLAYRDLMAVAPDVLSCYAVVANVPPADPFPEEYRGKPAIALVACYTGPQERGISLLEPLGKLGTPILKAIGPMPYTTLQQSFDAGTPSGTRWYWKSHYLNQLSDEAIEEFIVRARNLAGPLSIVAFEPMGGAISRITPDATAFPHRNANFTFGIYAGWLDPADDQANIAWTRQFHQAMAPYSTGGMYLNYLDRDDGNRVAEAFGKNYRRLQQVKATYDPDNFFRLNQNIKPRA